MKKVRVAYEWSDSHASPLCSLFPSLLFTHQCILIPSICLFLPLPPLLTFSLISLTPLDILQLCLMLPEKAQRV
jgi:hypothetical protein